MRPPPAALPPWRLFLPLAGVWGATVIALTVAARRGLWWPPGPWDLVRWHAHEMIFGHVLAGFAGVLLTALPRWTGCAPLAPPTVLLLAAIWAAGRSAALVDPTGTALVLSPFFPAALAVVAGRRAIAAQDRRDLPLIGLLGLLAIADLGLTTGDGAIADAAQRGGLAGMVAIAAVMGGRVAPALTRHLALTQGRELDLAAPAGFERAVAAVTIAALGAWVGGLSGPLAAALLGLAGLLHLARLARWRGWTSLRRPSILALHLGYLGLPIGFVLLGFDTIGTDVRLADGGVHALGVAVLGLLCFAVQASVARRHAGRALTRDRLADLGCAALLVAVAARGALSAEPWNDPALVVAAIAWIAAEAVLVVLALRPATIAEPARETTVAPPS